MFALFYPAKVFTFNRASRTLAAETVAGVAITYVDGNIWFDIAHRKGRITYSGKCISACMAVGGHLVPFTHGGPSLDEMRSRVAANADRLQAIQEAFAARLADPAGYEARASARAAKREAEAREAEAREAEAREAARVKREAELQAARAALLAGKQVTTADFLELCALHNVPVPIQTIGSMRKRVGTIGQGLLTCKEGYSGNPWPYFRELVARL